jgi:hypothetical protein
MMPSDRQLQQIRQALADGNNLQAYRIYQQACRCDIQTARDAVDRMKAELNIQPARQPINRYSSQQSRQPAPARKGKFIAFIIFDLLVFAGVVWWFMNRPGPADPADKQATTRTVVPASSIDSDYFKVKLDSGQTFQSLYLEKMDSWAYSRRKSHRKKHYDDLDEEPAIKTARSQQAARRPLPLSNTINDITSSIRQPIIDGVIDEQEWSEAFRLTASDNDSTTIRLASDGNWLFIACDARQELTRDGFDQFRVYLHAGLIPEMKHERIHLGRSSSLTTIRQTTFRWQGPVSDDEDERWKMYPMNDRGIYRYAVGATNLQPHRQYELAIHLAEAGIHPGVPFTLHAIVETDPLRDSEGKFKRRQYLGEFGTQKEPLWWRIN